MSDAAEETQETQETSTEEETKTEETSTEEETKTEETSTEEETKTEETSAKEEESKVPDAYDLGDLAAADDPMLKELTPVLKEIGLGNEEATKLASKYQEYALAQVDSWVEDAKADKEIGGDALDANVAVAKNALETYGSPELTELLDTTGLGNHKEVIRFFYNVGKTLAEDNPGRGGPASGARDRASILYKD